MGALRNERVPPEPPLGNLARTIRVDGSGLALGGGLARIICFSLENCSHLACALDPLHRRGGEESVRGGAWPPLTAVAW